MIEVRVFAIDVAAPRLGHEEQVELILDTRIHVCLLGQEPLRIMKVKTIMI